MHPVLLKVTNFLQQSLKDGVEVDDVLLNNFANKCKAIVKRQLSKGSKKGFRPIMSNIGLPLCRLQMEKANAPRDESSYNMKMIGIYGDLVEALALLIMKSAGVNIVTEDEPVDLEIGESIVSGRFDLQINEGSQSGIYDIKSVSSWSFNNKDTYNNLAEGDDFGYVAQGFMYSQAAQEPFGGWIVVDKESGKWNVIETPITGGLIQEETIKELDAKLIKLRETKPGTIDRQFELVPETFRKKLTGRKYLCKTCEFCPFKVTCWGKISFEPVRESESNTPPWRYYVEEK